MRLMNTTPWGSIPNIIFGQQFNINKFHQKITNKTKQNKNNYRKIQIPSNEIAVFSFYFEKKKTKIIIRPSTTSHHHHMVTFSSNEILFVQLQSGVRSVSFQNMRRNAWKKKHKKQTEFHLMTTRIFVQMVISHDVRRFFFRLFSRKMRNVFHFIYEQQLNTIKLIFITSHNDGNN